MLCLILCYGFAQYLPESNTFFNIGDFVRYHLCTHIFKKCSKHVSIERKAWFSTGKDIKIGDCLGIA